VRPLERRVEALGGVDAGGVLGPVELALAERDGEVPAPGPLEAAADVQLVGHQRGVAVEVHGTPKDLASARDLALRDKYQFQWRAVSLAGAVPFGGKKKGADTGIDGIVRFKPDGRTSKKAIVSVKCGGNVGVGMLKDLIATVDREKARVGLFLTLAEPTRQMRTEAVAAGFYMRHPEARGCRRSRS
jgi:hypothetical protein